LQSSVPRPTLGLMTRWPLRLAWLAVWLTAVLVTVGGASGRTLDTPSRVATKTGGVVGHASWGALWGAVDTAPIEARNALRAASGPASPQACRGRGDGLDSAADGPALPPWPFVQESLLPPSHDALSVPLPLPPCGSRHASPQQARAPPWLG
jgi:hypothetical protein